MHVALPPTANNTKTIHHSHYSADNNPSRQQHEPSLETRIQAANLELASYEIRNKEQSQIPSNAKKINDTKAKYNLPDDIEIHFHKQKDPATNEIMINPVTGKPFKIAEFVSKDHRCNEHKINALHQTQTHDQKKTSICTGTPCEVAPNKPVGFFQKLFSIAA